MEYCPNCNNLMRWYLKQGCGCWISGYHCDNCNYDSNDSYTYITASGTGGYGFKGIECNWLDCKYNNNTACSIDSVVCNYKPKEIRDDEERY